MVWAITTVGTTKTTKEMKIVSLFLKFILGISYHKKEPHLRLLGLWMILVAARVLRPLMLADDIAVVAFQDKSQSNQSDY